MACLFAARLAPHSSVTMLGSWPEGITALRASGVILVEGDKETSRDVKVADDPHGCGQHRIALVLVKSWQTARAAAQLRQCLTADGVALSLQNGYGNLQVLQEALGAGRATLGVTTTGATLLSPGRVRSGGDGPMCFGPHEGLEPLLPVLQSAGFEVEVSDDLDGLVWGKLAINAGINPLTGILGIPNGQLLEDALLTELMGAAAEEVAAVANALGVRLPYRDPAATVAEIAKTTAANHSSMLQDIMRGAPTEIEAISGAIVRQGQQANVPTPVNRILWTLVRAIVSARRGSNP